ncbi:MAG: hypothetical protein O7E52_12495 [Candidatus Poribacteria bacterium]|nr:hypothetical protein [Candidatus Poribacteria bacterium]
MLRTYKAILKGSHLEWIGETPEYDKNQPLDIEVTISDHSAPSNVPDCGQQMAEILEQLAKNDAFSEIADAVSWQGEIRKDRPLPGRND